MSTSSDEHFEDDQGFSEGREREHEEKRNSQSREADEVYLLDVLLLVLRRKKTILQSILFFALLGGIYAMSVPSTYTSEARLIRESQSEEGGLTGRISSNNLLGLGGSFSGGGLTPAAYPTVLRSRAVRLAVAKDTFRFPDTEHPMTYVEYANRPPGLWERVMKYTVWLPWTATYAAMGAMSSETTAVDTTTEENGSEITLTKEERRGANAVKGMVSPTVDSETGLMSISVTASDPTLAADLAGSFVDHLKTRVRQIRTERVRDRLQFTEQRFGEVEKELEVAEERLAQFLEKNQNPTTATLQFQRDRLRRQVSFKEQLYSDLQSKRTQTRFDLQRQQPVVTVVEESMPPTTPSGPNRLLYFLAAVVFGGGVGLSLVLVQAFLANWAERSEENRAKLEELKASLIPDAIRRQWNGSNQSKEPDPHRADDVL
ncbi:Wzz/FepE/Etk N-terminal domain-containing protein [Salinibacter ruber]|jgi:LPS O-antigen subunit length determinant protein (WzzB/FepE family)|uniref:Wzz/FepE/Etk N-terminal domain-containing protein n=1 Tax=Salinibacter ruber TaxID=146919 RepID=UPI00160BD9FC|nr:Wzz/FepE/Etk N-terminal domain-containing protein [Salinibacter ruber]MBB4062666.1 LPS O-antigen subunit length determinant protein (WzzB/FepE family) [Salinibacter ruber]